jgi:hypothetical protein
MHQRQARQVLVAAAAAADREARAVSDGVAVVQRRRCRCASWSAARCTCSWVHARHIVLCLQAECLYVCSTGLSAPIRSAPMNVISRVDLCNSAQRHAHRSMDMQPEAQTLLVRMYVESAECTACAVSCGCDRSCGAGYTY